jgi:hypothetical protein
VGGEEEKPDPGSPACAGAGKSGATMEVMAAAASLWQKADILDSTPMRS